MALDSRPFIPVAAEWLRYQANEPDAVEDLAIELREAFEAGAAVAFGLMGMAEAIRMVAERMLLDDLRRIGVVS